MYMHVTQQLLGSTFCFKHAYLQVRLTENKLDIVRNVLDSSPTAYRDYEKVSTLFHTCMYRHFLTH